MVMNRSSEGYLPVDPLAALLRGCADPREAESRVQAAFPAWEVPGLQFWRIGEGTGVTPKAALRNQTLVLRAREIAAKHATLAMQRVRPIRKSRKV